MIMVGRCCIEWLSRAAGLQGFADTVQLLLDLGSPTDLRDYSKTRMTAYDLAVEYKRGNVLKG